MENKNLNFDNVERPINNVNYDSVESETNNLASMNQDIRVINGQNWEIIKNHFQKQGLADEYDKVIKSLAKNRGQWTREQIDGFMQYLIQSGLTEEQVREVMIDIKVSYDLYYRSYQSDNLDTGSKHR